MRSEALKRAQQKYRKKIQQQKKHYKLTLELDNEKDKEIIAQINKQESKASYIRNLIKKDIMHSEPLEFPETDQQEQGLYDDIDYKAIYGYGSDEGEE